MVVASLMYPTGPDIRFDEDYYFGAHIPLVQRLLGERGPTAARFLRGKAAADGGTPPYQMVALLDFASMDDVRNAFAGPASAEVLGDIANFTNAQPVVQISDEAGPG
jgi:uncharacterized protein (TIGR02118 family)